MGLTREFIETIKERADRDPDFRVGMLQDAAAAFITGEPELGRLLLRDYVKATIGFEALSEGLGDIRPNSLMRMLSTKGNPSSKNLSAIMAYLQWQEGVALNVGSHKGKKPKRSLEKA